MIPHQKLCGSKGFTVTVLEDGEDGEGMLAKEQLLIQLLSPSINKDRDESNIEDMWRLEMCVRMKESVDDDDESDSNADVVSSSS